jgi:hypothetical protein
MKRLKTALLGLNKAAVHQRIDKLISELTNLRKRGELEEADHEAQRKALHTEYEHLQWRLEQKKAAVDRLIHRKMDLMAEQDARPANVNATTDLPSPVRGSGELGEQLLRESLIPQSSSRKRCTSRKMPADDSEIFWLR